jgi:sugar diacid utilization regulator
VQYDLVSEHAVQLAQDPARGPESSGGSLSAASRRSLRGILPQLRTGEAEDAVMLEGDADRDIAEVRLIDSIDQLHEVGAGALVVLDRRLSHIAGGYLMDVAVRQAVSRDIAGLVLTASDGAKVSLTARSMCRKSGLALVRLSPAHDLNTVLSVVAREVADTLHVTVDRARQAVDAVNRIAGHGSTSTDLAALASRVLGYEVQVADAPPAECSDVLSVPVVVSQPDGAQFVAGRLPDEDANTLVEGVLWRLASEGSRTMFVAEQAERTTMLSVDEILSQLLGVSRETRDDLSLQARRLGIEVDGWHIVARFELDIPHEGNAADLLPYETRELLARVALATASGARGAWHTAHDPTALWLLHSRQASPPRDLGLHVHRLMGSVVATLQHEVPELRTYVGVGTVHSAAAGIAGSATEAKVAATHARSWRRVNHPVSFDAVGIRSTVVEWYRSPTVQESINALFAPLDKVPQKRRNETIEFLGTYLDCGCSIARTAEAVHLHRNAVRTRLQRALALLGVDLEDADQRLFVHLACRAHRILGVSHP